MTSWDPAYATATVRLYRVDPTGSTLVEVSSDEVLFGLGWNTETLSNSWVTAPLDGAYFVVSEATYYGGLDHVPTLEEALTWNPSRTYHLNSTSPTFTCIGPPPPPPICGDGVLDPPSEACDDGNTTDGDGCSAACSIEPAPFVCGDGEVDMPSEECDDGNNTDGDGCSALCTIEPLHGCTYTIGYWKTHNALAKNRSQRQAWPIAEGTLLCGKRWLDVLGQPPRGDGLVILAHQWIGARLNVAMGTSAPLVIQRALARAALLMQDCDITSAERAEATDLASVLDNYNSGLAGPSHCR